MLERAQPHSSLYNTPCSQVAVITAYHKELLAAKDFDKPAVSEDGYCSLKDMNKAVRKDFDVKKYVYFKKAERKPLKLFSFDHSAIVCLEGHYIYVDGEAEQYYSFFDNLEDNVVAIWYL